MRRLLAYSEFSFDTKGLIMCHFIGLGSASCNLLENIMLTGFEGRYTFVTLEERFHRPRDIEYIKWVYPENYVDSDVMGNVTIPERLWFRIMTHPDNRISACLGEYTGISLSKAILSSKWPDFLHFKYLFFMPHRFKDENQVKIALDFIKMYKDFKNVYIVPFPPSGN